MKKIENKVKIAISIIAFICIFTGINFGLRYLCIDDSGQFTRNTFYELYGQKQNIDVLFLGSSHCMRSLDPTVADRLLGVNTFNAGTSAQYLDGSYTVLREAGKQNDISEVYLELYYGQIGFAPENRGNVMATYIISEYLRPSLNKVKFLREATPEGYFVMSYIPARRNWRNLFDGATIVKTLINKSQQSYKNYDYFGEYAGKGFIASENAVEKGSYVRKDEFFAIHPLSDHDKKYFDLIIEYCRENNIELTCFSAPMSDFRLVSLGNYDEYVSMMKEYLNGKGIAYYDFNLCKYSMVKFGEEDFMDDNHLNYKGAGKLTEIFCRLRSGELTEKDLFYDSYQEKISNRKNFFYGLMVHTDKESGKYTLEPICSNDMPLRFTVYKLGTGEDTPVLLQENSFNREVILPVGEKGEISVEIMGEDGALLGRAVTAY